MKIQVVFLLLAAGLEAVVAEDKYFEIGGKLYLKPESVPKEGITSINWKHKGNFVAEWIKDSVPLSYFGDFNGRTDLDTITGELTIRSMRKADEGIFSVEVNSKVQTVEYSARGITHLRDKNVEVLARPVSCNFNLPHCNLSCDADVADAGPVQYFWQQDEGPWDESQKDININNDEETRLIKTFSCKIKNLISDKESGPLENPFKKTQQSASNGDLAVWFVFLVFLILAGIALAVFAYKYPQKLVPCLPCVAGHPEQHPHTEESPGDGENGASARTQYETVTFNGTSTPQHIESSVTVHLNIEANTEASNKTSSEPDDVSSEKTPLKNPETSNKTSSEPDDVSSEKTPLKDSETETSNGTPEES